MNEPTLGWTDENTMPMPNGEYS